MLRERKTRQRLVDGALLAGILGALLGFHGRLGLLRADLGRSRGSSSSGGKSSGSSLRVIVTLGGARARVVPSAQ